MTQRHDNKFTVGPMAAVATVPGEFISGAIFGAVEGACRAVGLIGRAVRGLNRR